MPRLGDGFTSRVCVRERPTGEGSAVLLESRPGRSAYPCAAEVAAQRVLFRHILIQAVHDLGCGKPSDGRDVDNFLKTNWFSTLCEYSDWEEEWVRKLFFSVKELGEGVKKEVTKQTVHMMKAIAEIRLG